MSFVRAEALTAINRWREALAGAAIAGIGLWWIFGTGGLLFWLGFVLLPTGLSLAGLGIQRGRLRTGSVGPGIVQVDEGRVVYFGPLTGGGVDLATLSRLEIDPSGHPAHWVLHQPAEAPLFIPVNATGAEQLFDAFAMLPRFPTAKAVDLMTHPPEGKTLLWHRASPERAGLEHDDAAPIA
ncbi:MAG: hypothetical protein AAF678_00035 [Pseudomonadota bacterium]